MTRLLLVCGLAVLCAACGDDPVVTSTSPSVPEGLVASSARLFSGTLARGGSAFYSFTLGQNSGVFVTLASVTGPTAPDALATPLRIGIGVPRGTGCDVTTSAVVTPALTPQIREYTTQGVRCVSVGDPGTLDSSVRFAVRIGYFQ